MHTNNLIHKFNIIFSTDDSTVCDNCLELGEYCDSSEFSERGFCSDERTKNYGERDEMKSRSTGGVQSDNTNHSAEQSFHSESRYTTTQYNQ